MGHGFGELYKGLRIISTSVSPYELKAFSSPAKSISKIMRRTMEEFLYIVPLGVLTYLTFATVESSFEHKHKKKPGEYDHES